MVIGRVFTEGNDADYSLPKQIMSKSEKSFMKLLHRTAIRHEKRK